MHVQAIRHLARCVGAAFFAVACVSVPVAQAQSGGAAARSEPTATAVSSRAMAGHPDLSGIWNRGGEGLARTPDSGVDARGNVTWLTRNRPCAPGQAECLPGTQYERDAQMLARRNPNRPVYRPEFWDRVQHLDVNGNTEDPGFSCFPQGVPRMGPPSQIVQSPTRVIFLYQNGNLFRVIPTDGRKHESRQVEDVTWLGHPVGRWEGQTLVVESVGFTDETWLANPGYFHTNNMRVTERLRREGDTLIYQATVHDPEVFMEPWVMDARRLQLNSDPAAFLEHDMPCDERDREHMVTKERH